MPPKSKNKISKTATTATTQPGPLNSASRPAWPTLTPLAPNSDLSLSTLIADQILTIPRLFTSSLSTKYVSFLKTLPLVTTPGKPKRGDAVRVNDRFQIDDPAFAARLWSETALQTLVTGGDIDGEALDGSQRRELFGGDILGLNPNIRIYRYSEGQYFDQHCMLVSNLISPLRVLMHSR